MMTVFGDIGHTGLGNMNDASKLAQRSTVIQGAIQHIEIFVEEILPPRGRAAQVHARSETFDNLTTPQLGGSLMRTTFRRSRKALPR